MSEWTRKVHYYETDQMGITHHSNYVRWMEEARLFYLDEMGYGLKRLEAEGITSPVVDLHCRYLRTTTFDDVIRIAVRVEAYTGVRLTFSYVMTDAATGETVMTASSSHCFLNARGKPVALRRQAPALDALLCRAILP